jgi:diaminohydroxyphosphoribosylaminopyrimidine deaminase/5-amino-6-(5-phosphoribosylamino)uracil reductase
MKRALELAQRGFGNVAPNPMVGCVIVHNDLIIGEGWHRKYGEAHAEVNAINSVVDKTKLPESTLYVTLEPCNHHGKTPPCANLIIDNNINKVVIATEDPNPLVRGQGIKLLKSAGIIVTTGICQDKANNLNRRFNTFHIDKRPYVIAKWAESADGFIDKIRSQGEKGSFVISGEESHTISHKWRTEEQGILIGLYTALNDQPQLTARKWSGNNPLRILIDPNLEVKADNPVLNGEARTLVFNRLETRQMFNVERIQLDFRQEIIPLILDYLHYEGIQSLLVEGGKRTIQSFADLKLIDEIRRFTSNHLKIKKGLISPQINNLQRAHYEIIGQDILETFTVSKT